MCKVIRIVLFVNLILVCKILKTHRAQKKWNGDVWKAITEFRTFDEIDVCVGSFDNGIGLITNKKNKNKLTINNQRKKINYKKLTYEDYFYNFNTFLNLVGEKDFFNKVNDS